MRKLNIDEVVFDFEEHVQLRSQTSSVKCVPAQDVYQWCDRGRSSEVSEDEPRSRSLDLFETVYAGSSIQRHTPVEGELRSGRLYFSLLLYMEIMCDVIIRGYNLPSA